MKNPANKPSEVMAVKQKAFYDKEGWRLKDSSKNEGNEGAFGRDVANFRRWLIISGHGLIRVDSNTTMTTQTQNERPLNMAASSSPLGFLGNFPGISGPH